MLLKERRQNNYDFLRLFASICVMFYHSFALLDKVNEEPSTLLTNGKVSAALIGLSIFFSISGYLIAGSALRSPTMINYLWKRLLRIQPLLILLCIVTILVLGPVCSSFSASDYFSEVHTWTYFRNVMPVFGLQYTLPGVFTHSPAGAGVNGSLWTLVAEERLYLVMCILFILKSRKKAFVICILFLNVVFVVYKVSLFDISIPYFDGLPFFYALVFLNSALLYLLGIHFRNGLYYYLASGILIFSIGIIFTWTEVLACYSMPLMINSLAHIKGFLNNAGKWGDFTYGTYVFAYPIQQILIGNYNFNQPYYLFIATLLITFPLAILSWNLIEKRFLKLKKIVQ
ncbi:MAG: acyltransferase [Ginsengibacter sp.]